MSARILPSAARGRARVSYAEYRAVRRRRARLRGLPSDLPRRTVRLAGSRGAGANARFVEFFTDVVGAWWPPERRHVDSGYRTLPFPFDELAVPPQTLTTQWTLEQLAGYARSGSATARYRADRGSDPVLWLEAALGPWFPGPGARMRVAWPLCVRAARLPSR